MALDLTFQACSNCTTFLQKLEYVNSLTDVGSGGILGILFVVVIGAILFLMMKSYPFEKAFGVSAFITSILGIFISLISDALISNNVIYLLIILLVISLFLLIKKNDANQGF